MELATLLMDPSPCLVERFHIAHAAIGTIAATSKGNWSCPKAIKHWL